MNISRPESAQSWALPCVGCWMHCFFPPPSLSRPGITTLCGGWAAVRSANPTVHIPNRKSRSKSIWVCEGASWLTQAVRIQFILHSINTFRGSTIYGGNAIVGHRKSIRRKSIWHTFVLSAPVDTVLLLSWTEVLGLTNDEAFYFSMTQRVSLILLVGGGGGPIGM